MRDILPALKKLAAASVRRNEHDRTRADREGLGELQHPSGKLAVIRIVRIQRTS
jgi:hypothetical protein